ncbi:aldo-keto reductase AKR2E4-like isoform X2 [Arctopsyche grandis]|uniref:aldo-keto reductase AKR2E4-like isoform X2 n=1 Tax=Arctopsyche grandis TaxID=121162 RepID=UPI00406D8EE0
MEKFILFSLVVLFAAASEANVKSGKSTTVALNDGTEIPVLGLGTWLNGSDPTSTQKAVEVAIEAGYRHIDTAAIYGTETHVGKALQAKIKDGTIKREDMYITTKLWNTRHAEDQVVPALRESLKELQLEQVDLYLIHWPVSFNENGTFNDLDYVDTWRGMEEAKKLGLTKSIGISNFNEKQIERLLKSAKVKPVVNQVEVNPNLTQKKLIQFCKEKDIHIVAYTPLGSMPESRAKNPNAPAPKLDDPILSAMGEKYKKNTVQIVLRYLIDRGLIVIPKSSTPTRVRENIDLFDFNLTPVEVEKIDEFNSDFRLVHQTKWKDSSYFPF